MNIPPIETVRSLLKDMKLNVVAEAADVNYITLTRFANGTTQDPGYEFMFKLTSYLHDKFKVIK